MKKLDAPMPSCGDTSCEMLVSPFPVPRTKPLHVRATASRRRVVFFDTRKPNSLTVLKKATAKLRALGIEVMEPIATKSDPSRVADDKVLDWIAREEGLILCGVAD